MPRTPSLCAIFATLLCACGSDTLPGATATSSGGGCGSEGSKNQEVPWSILSASLDSDGTILMNDCPALCSYSDGLSEITGCSMVDDPPEGTTGDQTTSPEGMTTGDGPGDGGSMGADSSSTGGSTESGSTESGSTESGSTESGSTEGGSTEGGSAGETTSGGTTGGEAMGSTGEELLVTIQCDYYEICIGGRGHEALRSVPDMSGNDRLGCWLSAMAHSEAASVLAFRSLADELAAHGAPADLVQRARAAASDEVDHAAAMARLARQRGAPVKEPSFDTIEVRSLTRIATENAVEGCVRETWAALEAAHQARAAADPELRRVMAGIAVDETRHAQFSHDLDRWIRTQLGDEAVTRVEQARRQAADELLEGMQGERDPLLLEQAGLPAVAMARRLCEGLREELWV